MSRLKSILFFYIGLNSTLNIFRDSIGSIYILYVLSMGGLACCSLVQLFFLEKKIGEWPFYLKIFSIIISLLVSYIYGINFMMENLIGLSSIFLLAIIFIVKPQRIELEYFIKGYKYSLLIDFIYATIQLLVLLSTNMNINGYLYSFLNIDRDASWETRIAGLCWDPYLLGMFCATGFFLFKSKWVKIWILVLLFFSYSRAGQVALLGGGVYYYYPIIKKKLSIRNFAFFLLCLSVLLLFLFPIIFAKLDFGRGFTKESVGWRRVEHYTYFPKIWSNDKSIMQPLFGGAPYYSGARFYYSEVDSMCKRTISRYDWMIESDIAGILWSRGILGFFVHLFIYMYTIVKSRYRLLSTLAVVIFFGGIGYNYDLAIFTNMIVLFVMNYDHVCASDKRNAIKLNERNNIILNIEE